MVDYTFLLSELQDMLYHKSALLEASNARIADLELRLNIKNVGLENDKREIDLIKEQFNKQLFEIREECKTLREIQCQYEENKEEEESKKKFLEELPKFGADVIMVDSNTSVSEQDAKYRLGLMSAADIDDSCNDISILTPK